MRRHYVSPVGESMVGSGGYVLEGQGKMVTGGFVEKIVKNFGALGVGGG
jgi:hypothetical protein